MNVPINFEYLKPFAAAAGKIIRMKSLFTIHGVQLVEAEDSHRYKLEELRELTPEELTELEAEEAYEEALIMAEAENKIN